MRTGPTFYATLLLLAVLGAQAGPIPPGFFTASEKYTDCLRREAFEQDDGISDAATIAEAIEPLCRENIVDEMKALGNNDADARALSERADIRATQHEEALQWVLTERKARPRNSN